MVARPRCFVPEPDLSTELRSFDLPEGALPVVMLGLKLDLEAKREVSRSDMKELMKKFSGIAGYLEGAAFAVRILSSCSELEGQ
jgi:hypothetical protein